MGRKYYIDPATGEKVYIRDKVPSMAQYRKKSDQDEIDTQIKEDLAAKMTEPTSGLAVGKYFKVASIDSDGHAVLEACDLPVATSDTLGMVKALSGNGCFMNGENLMMNVAAPSIIDARSNTRAAITPYRLVYAVDSVLCSTAASEALSAEQQAAARARLGAVGGTWELIDTITCDGETLTYDRTAETNGNPYKFKSIMVDFSNSSGNISSSTVFVHRSLDNSAWSSSFNGSVKFATAALLNIGGYIFPIAQRRAANSATSVGVALESNGTFGTISRYNTGDITAVRIRSYANFSSGTVIKLYAIRS